MPDTFLREGRMNDPAAEVAQKLSAKFFEEGRYTLSTAHRGKEIRNAIPVAANDSDGVEEVYRKQNFAGLAVQSVGYELGSPKPTVHIYVSKGARKDIAKLPSKEGDVFIKVNKIGRLIIRPEQANSSTSRGNLFLRHSRIACGSSCAPSGENYSGTIGALIRKPSDRKLYVLSCNHVLAACNHVPVGMHIMSPSNKDSSPSYPAPRAIARHKEICELRSGEPTLVSAGREDLALAEITSVDAVSSWQGEDPFGYDAPKQAAVLKSNLSVKKVGRTTGLTIGRLQAALNTPTPVLFRTRHFTATVYFHDVWSVVGQRGAAFALPGDSGSLVVTEDAEKAVGIIFAAQPPDYALMIPIQHVQSCFSGISLVDRHGV
jgi:hypothetical protein